VSARRLHLDDVAPEPAVARGPLDMPRAKALRRTEVAHRGRKVSFVAIDSSESEKDALCLCLLDLVKKRREANDAS
jgi:hypothetical protein